MIVSIKGIKSLYTLGVIQDSQVLLLSINFTCLSFFSLRIMDGSGQFGQNFLWNITS